MKLQQARRKAVKTLELGQQAILSQLISDLTSLETKLLLTSQQQDKLTHSCLLMLRPVISAKGPNSEPLSFYAILRILLCCIESGFILQLLEHRSELFSCTIDADFLRPLIAKELKAQTSKKKL